MYRGLGPLSVKERLVVSVSGGRSSMYMAYRLYQEYGDKFDLLLVFANTGQELEETLLFVHQFTEVFCIPVVWIEAEVDPEVGKGTKHRVVDYYSASRDGRPFEDVIRKYGIPNVSRPRCTEELKIFPINSYKRSVGWKGVQQAIGIRADEPRRYAKRKPKTLYPLVDWFPVTKQDVVDWWAKQSFDLNLLEWEGNCAWCYKKSLTKLKKMADKRPEVFDFPERMEKEYGMVRSVNGKPFRFFRGNRTAADIRALNIEVKDLIIEDITSECGETCEAI